jgi:hypothetical protein
MSSNPNCAALYQSALKAAQAQWHAQYAKASASMNVPPFLQNDNWGVTEWPELWEYYACQWGVDVLPTPPTPPVPTF